MGEPSLQELLNVASEAAYVAGRKSLAWYNAGVAVDTKSNDTPVTVADREGEMTIRQIVGKHFPDHSVLGEEHGEVKGSSDYKWIIDPIDGTKSFIHGVPMYGVLIGVEVKGRASVGAVYLPATDELICAADGLGCTWNGRRARVSDVSDLKEATLVVTSAATLMKRSDAYEKLASVVKLNRGWGDCYGYVMVATGRAEIMLDATINPWDCAPMVPILREAGGSFSTWRGEETIWGKDAVATNGALNAEVIDILKAETLR
ncbi:MAG TPA: inositol monophosphatase family protein [Tepidisphaeraceae bacterium]|jgi:histidinol phosphatase-like enzyme (inositol monophosphatase family)